MTKLRQRRTNGPWIVAGGVGLAAALIGLNVQTTTAHPRYNNNGTGCIACHQDFDGPFSFQGETFPDDSKHEMHRSNAAMDTDCLLCHTQPGDDPFIGSSAQGGFGCLGCHGRDYGGEIGVTGAGLRAHHAANGVNECAGCHPNDPVPLGEAVLPPYYGMMGTLADDPCNSGPEFLENWTTTVGNTQGLDNDGDNLYDEDDPNCSCPYDCGDMNGTVDTIDFLALLGQWGQLNTCDRDGDGVDTIDFLGLLGSWGECP